MLIPLLTLLAGYLIGSIPFGYLVARLRGVDILRMGSGNIGATNVGRVLGRKFGLLVFFLDFAKGAAPVLLAGWAARHSDSPWRAELPAGTLEVGAGLLAFLGHLFPLYLRFRGGKGVATGSGVVAMLVPSATGVAALVWLFVVLATRYVSLASVCAALALVAARLQSHGTASDFAADPRSWFCLLAGGLVVVRHRANLARLAQGRENRIKESTFMFAATKAIHVLCVGLWFGSTVFFSFIVAPSLFARFEAIAAKPAQERPWFPPSPTFAKHDDALNGPREQGLWAAGYAVGPLFPALFLLQCACGFGAVASALPWLRQCPGEKVHYWRVTVIFVALSCVLAGWPLEHKVRDLQGERQTKTLSYLVASGTAADSARTEMQQARQAFGKWHGISLLLSMVGLTFVAAALVLAAFLPAAPSPRPIPSSEPISPARSDEMPTESLEG